MTEKQMHILSVTDKPRERFFRRPLICTARHARDGLKCRENGERVRIARTLHTS